MKQNEFSQSIEAISTYFKERRTQKSSEFVDEHFDRAFEYFSNNKYQLLFYEKEAFNAVDLLEKTALDIGVDSTSSMKYIFNILLLKAAGFTGDYRYTFDNRKPPSGENKFPNKDKTLRLYYGLDSDHTRMSLMKHIVSLHAELESIHHAKKTDLERLLEDLIERFFNVNPFLFLDITKYWTTWPSSLQQNVLNLLCTIGSSSQQFLINLMYKEKRSFVDLLYQSYKENSRLSFRNIWLVPPYPSQNTFLERIPRYFACYLDRIDIVEMFDFAVELSNAVYDDDMAFYTHQEKAELSSLEYNWDEREEIRDLVARPIRSARYQIAIDGAHATRPHGAHAFEQYIRLNTYDLDYKHVTLEMLSRTFKNLTTRYDGSTVLEKLTYVVKNLIPNGELSCLLTPNEWFYETSAYDAESNSMLKAGSSIAEQLFEHGLLSLSGDVESIINLPWGKMPEKNAFTEACLNIIKEKLKDMDEPFSSINKMRKPLRAKFDNRFFSSLTDFASDLKKVKGKRQLELLMDIHKKTPMDVLSLCEQSAGYKPRIKSWALSLLS